MYSKFIKRFIDIILSLVGIAILVLPAAIVAIIIVIDDPGPAIFKQKRAGKGKKLFWLYKFRSMKVNTPDIPTHLLENPQQYISKVGSFIRKASIDELPQLLNVLNGTMSIVGPRPSLPYQADNYTERQHDRFKMRPGITGWAQINGRDELEIPLKARLDGEYVERLGSSSLNGIKMDLKCFFGTIKAVLRSEGVVEGGTGELDRRAEEKETANAQ